MTFTPADALAMSQNLASCEPFLLLDKATQIVDEGSYEQLSRLVFKITYKDRAYVVRFGKKKVIARELFQHDVLQLLGVHTPNKVRLDDANATHAIFRAMRISDHEFDRWIANAGKLGPVFASLTDFVPVETGLQYLQRRSGLRISQHKSPGRDEMLNWIPENIQEQVATLWVVLSILGTEDLHPGNWMTDGETVWAIDYAGRHIYAPFQYSPRSHKDRTPLPLIMHSDPYEFPLGIDKERVAQFAQQANGRTLINLFSLFPNRMRALALANGYNPPAAELRAMALRLRYIFELRHQ